MNQIRYIESARHHLHGDTSFEVLAHLWNVSWSEDWQALRSYIRGHVEKKRLREVEQ